MKRDESPSSTEPLRRDSTGPQAGGSGAVDPPAGSATRRRARRSTRTRDEIEPKRDAPLARRAETAAPQDPYRELYDLAPVGYLSLDPAGLILRANLAAAALLGVERDQLAGTSLSEYVQPSDQESLFLHCRKALASRSRQSCELTLVRRDGGSSIVRLDTDTVAADDECGHQCLMVLTDITSRVEMERELRRADEWLHLAQRAAGAGTWDWDLATGQVEWNKELYELFGIDPKQGSASFDLWRSVLHPEDCQLASERIEQAIQDHTSLASEYRIVRPDGQVRWIRALGRATYDGCGRALRMAGVCIDITEARRLDEVQAFLAQTAANAESDEPFFNALARYLARSLAMEFVCIDKLEEDGLTARTLAVWNDDHFEGNVTYALKGTPCGEVVSKKVCCVPAGVCQLFPQDEVLRDLRAESYVGTTLIGHDGRRIGLIAVIGRRPLADRSLAEATLRMAAVRAAGELERLQAEDAVRESEEKFRRLFELSYDAHMLLEGERFIDCNDASVRMLGLSRREDLLAVRPRDISPEFQPNGQSSAKASVAMLDIAFEKGSHRFEWLCRRADGTPLYFDVLLTCVPLKGRTVIHSVCRDITDHKEAAVAALKEREQRFRTVADYTYDWEYWRSPTGEVVHISPACERITGYGPAEFTARPELFAEIVHHDDRVVWQEHNHLAQSGECFAKELEFRILTKSGQERWIGHVCRPVHGDRGEFLGTRGSNRDISDRKRAETALRMERDRLMGMLEATTDGACIIGRDHELKYVNPMVLSHFGQPNGRKCYQYFKGQTEICDPCTNEDICAGATVQREWSCHTNGRHYEMLDIPFEEPDGSPSKLRVFHDITARRRAEDEVRQRQAELARITRLGVVNEIAAGLAHEINQDLSVSVNYIEACSERLRSGRGTTAELLEDLEHAIAGAQRASEIIDRVRSFVRKRDSARTVVRLDQLVRETLDWFRSEIRRHAAQVNLELQEDLPAVQGDVVEIQQVIVNLLRNSLEAMADAGSEVRELTIRSLRAGDGRIGIELRDTGPGLSPDTMEKLFEPFYTTKHEGLGLGLAICRRIVEGHGGELSASSKSGEGAVFRMILPTASAVKG